MKIERRASVLSRTGLCVSELYKKMEKREFPKPVNLGPKSVGWVSDEVDAWIAARIAERDRQAEAA